MKTGREENSKEENQKREVSKVMGRRLKERTARKERLGKNLCHVQEM